MNRFASGLLLVCALVAPGLAQPSDPLVDADVAGPDPEVIPPTAKLALPPPPAFDLPPRAANGAPSIKELRVRGRRLLDTDITVTGVVTWVYDCVQDNLKPGLNTKAVQRMIEDDPTLCERAKFYVGDSATTAPDKSLWIVDVPRPWNALEMKRLKKQDRVAPDRCEPNDTTVKVCPPYKVGDKVVISGRFTQASPHSERNSDGLLVYQRMKNVTKNWESSAPATAASLTVPPTTAAWVDSPLPAVKPVVLAKVRKSVRSSSISEANQGTMAYGAKQWDTAIDHYTKAIAAWPDNHSAWYGMAAAHGQRRDWAKCAVAAAKAAQLVPTAAMYRLMYGRALYEAAIQQVKEDAARKQNAPVDQVDVDLSTTNFEKPLLELRYTVKLDPALWRAHYLIGSIHRHAGRTKDAAISYDHALQFGPVEPAPWIAAAELYRAWDYTDQAIQLMTQAALVVTAPADLSEIWFELGMGYDDKRSNDKAIEAFTKSLAARPDNHNSKFARGQVYFRAGKLDKAKSDLEDFLKGPGAGNGFFKQQASRMLMEIAAKTGRK